MVHEGLARLALGATRLAFAVTVAGCAILLAAAIVELATGEAGMSLVDAYWIGRLPWTPIGVGMALFGATAAVVAGLPAAWLVGGRLARTVATAATLPVGLWWLFTPMIPVGGACCGPRPAYDPITLAYSLPESALLLVITPALASAVALWLDRPRRTAPAAPDFRTVSGA
jgi:hypothetical protein